MPVPFDISRLLASKSQLEQQMQELLKLRRALCLLNAKLDWQQRSRSSRRISGAMKGTPNIANNCKRQQSPAWGRFPDRGRCDGCLEGKAGQLRLQTPDLIEG